MYVKRVLVKRSEASSSFSFLRRGFLHVDSRKVLLSSQNLSLVTCAAVALIVGAAWSIAHGTSDFVLIGKAVTV